MEITISCPLWGNGRPWWLKKGVDPCNLVTLSNGNVHDELDQWCGGPDWTWLTWSSEGADQPHSQQRSMEVTIVLNGHYFPNDQKTQRRRLCAEKQPSQGITFWAQLRQTDEAKKDETLFLNLGTCLSVCLSFLVHLLFSVRVDMVPFLRRKCLKTAISQTLVLQEEQAAYCTHKSWSWNSYRIRVLERTIQADTISVWTTTILARRKREFEASRAVSLKIECVLMSLLFVESYASVCGGWPEGAEIQWVRSWLYWSHREFVIWFISKRSKNITHYILDGHCATSRKDQSTYHKKTQTFY